MDEILDALRAYIDTSIIERNAAGIHLIEDRVTSDELWFRFIEAVKAREMQQPKIPKREHPFSFETTEDGYVIYRRGAKLAPWHLIDILNGNLLNS